MEDNAWFEKSSADKSLSYIIASVYFKEQSYCEPAVQDPVKKYYWARNS